MPTALTVDQFESAVDDKLDEQAEETTEQPEGDSEAPADEGESPTTSELETEHYQAILEKAKESEAWKEYTLDTLDISEAIAAKLIDAGIETLGQLQEYLAEKPLTEIKGIGAEKAAAVADAFADFWRTHPEFCETEESESCSLEAEQDSETDTTEEEKPQE